jgi:hypothetical protein
MSVEPTDLNVTIFVMMLALPGIEPTPISNHLCHDKVQSDTHERIFFLIAKGE